MAAFGFNVVRLIVSWSRLEPKPGQLDHGYINQIAETVNLARAHDIYVLLDMHQDAWGPHVFTPDGVSCPPGMDRAIGWDGAPEWATALTGTVATCRVVLREASLTVATSFQNFYLDVESGPVPPRRDVGRARRPLLGRCRNRRLRPPERAEPWPGDRPQRLRPARPVLRPDAQGDAGRRVSGPAASPTSASSSRQ